MRKKWTEEELNYLKNNYGEIPVTEMMEYLHIGQTAVYKKARELGLCKTFLWTPEKIEILKQYYATAPWEELFGLLGTRNKGSILKKACELKLSRDTYKWLPEQIEFLKENYNKYSAQELSQKLNKTESAVITKAYVLGITHHLWTAEEEEKLKELYPIHSNQYLADNIFIGRRKESIRTKALKMGLHKTKEKGVKKYYNKDLILQQLKEVSDQLGRSPLYNELIDLGLPSPKTFARMFGSYREALKILGLPINHSVLGNCIYKASDGTPCSSKAELAITEFFINNSVPFKKEVYYNSVTNDIRAGLKRFDWQVGNYYIEYFGLMHIDSYKRTAQEKISICEDNNINLIQLYPKDLGKIQEKLQIILN